MERNTKTTFSQLVDGDRFYKCSDKKREVWEATFNVFSAKRDIDIYSRRFNPDTEVIFLRHKTN